MDDILQFLKDFWMFAAPIGAIFSLVLWYYCWLLWVRMGRHPWQWLRTLLGRGLSVDELARRLEVSRDDLVFWQPTYRETFIPKKKGGARRLLIPDPALKALQRRILGRLLARLRVHPAACGFERGKSIVDNAKPHVGKAVVIKLDIVDFFPSITSERVEWYFRRVGWNAEASALLAKLCTHEGGLPQGAPTSPRLSNLLHFGLDSRLTRKMERFRGAYTRYADDLTLSLPREVPKRARGLIQYVRRLAKVYGLTLHLKGKLRVLRKHQQQRVTGLVVNQKVQLPRKTRRWLRAVEHRIRTTGKGTLSEAQLNGWNGLRQMVARVKSVE